MLSENGFFMLNLFLKQFVLIKFGKPYDVWQTLEFPKSQSFEFWNKLQNNSNHVSEIKHPKMTQQPELFEIYAA